VFILAIPVASFGEETEPSKQAKIVGGGEATPDGWPWMAALLAGPDSFFDQYCGATLIAPGWVLTAARCLTDEVGEPSPPLADLDVLLEVHDLVLDAGVLFDAFQVVLHPDWDPVTIDNDIALIQLSGTSDQTVIARTAQTLTGALVLGDNLTATGWGSSTADNSQFPHELHQVALPFMPFATCQGIVGPLPNGVSANMLCTETRATGTPVDTCGPDSGGPLMTFEDGQWKLVGVTSFGFTFDGDCAVLNLPSVFTRVANYDSWIVSVVPEPSAALLEFASIAGLVRARHSVG
jgi:secreted trypsin-like serine protease